MRPIAFHFTDDELRTEHPSTLAGKHGCHKATVLRAREARGIGGPPPPPSGRPVKFDWSALDPALSIPDNMRLTGCNDRDYVVRKMRGLRKNPLTSTDL